jgi:hypothetical protein
MSVSNAGSPPDAPQVNEDMGARISRLEMYMQQSSEAMRHQAELMATLTSVSESILQRLDTPLLASAGGAEQLAAMRELAPMTIERRSGGDADDVRRDLGAAMASAARRERVCCLLVLNSVTSTPQWIRQPEAAWGVCVVCVFGACV